VAVKHKKKLDSDDICFYSDQTDKVSMLEDVIEYVKSLQLQIQACTQKLNVC